MGLDMYLTKRIYVGANYEHRKITGQISILQDGKPIEINFNKVNYIVESVAYWRKANAIHRWFVENVQDGEDDCRDYYVSVDKLKELVDTCKQVLSQSNAIDGTVTNGYTYVDGKQVPITEPGKTIANPEVAEKLLPTISGFFFGSTGYDQYYLQDLQDTVDQIEPYLQNPDLHDEFWYHSSW